MLPRRLPKSPKRDKRLRSPAHLAFVRSHQCCVTLGDPRHLALVPCDGPIEAAHVRSGTNGGMGMKPGDDWTISLCAKHHRRQHEVSETVFERYYGIDMKALAREFAQRSPALRRARQGGER